MNMKKQQAGFTLIELVVVIVILGILAATALPRFVDLSGEARQGVADGIAGAAGSAMSINFAACAAVNHASGANCATIDACNDVGTILQSDVPAGYTVTGTLSTTNGATGTCTVTSDDTATSTATFTGIAAGNPVAVVP
jgi:MSHA pilin protein MshA